ncbi:ATP12 family chaperone protein [Marinibacterium profundimaris]|uniref:ATPase n=1 Tax=Marinibacterium profundimaris TaxID=1679460 RepID=A0A225NK42_9RHOB|nr:ATP12 family protein [Marinibacterium profundimaris]OWU73531.1 ATPase [Marinibacterium profundimaris]
MSEWAMKRFWTNVTVEGAKDGHRVLLDGRRVKTPAKTDLVLPTEGLAQAVAGEWAAQEGKVDPMSMPCTRSANSAIDRVAPQRTEVAAMLAAYGDSDLLCYRADAPEELIARQAGHWDPVLDWAEEALDARLETRTGVMHVPQDGTALAALERRVHDFGPFHLAAFHDLVGLTGSLVLGFAAASDWRRAEEIWTLSRVDEDWQAEQWGVDEEAAELAERKRQEFLHAKRFFDLAGPSGVI